ncbi:hypothetical protein ACIBI9_65055 [Nonomuraea sp. NPDC050451]|uniref:hypothetical protein n=1 Tax=Nonomuraea sp. NPDC050451 TaxID=3364364 RepID=UPI00379A8C67
MEFPADEQAGAYGRFVEEPTRPETERFFYLDDMDRRLIGKRRVITTVWVSRCSCARSGT